MNNKIKKITLILGTAREGRQSVKPFNYLAKTLEEMKDVEITKVDVLDFKLDFTIAPWVDSVKTKKYRNIIKNSDAFIIVSPEYNHSYPGELKILLDQAMEEYMNKPVLVAGVSSGGFGGVRVVESLMPILNELGLKYIAYPLYFSKVKDTFLLKKVEIDNKYKSKVDKSINELIKNI